VVTFEAEGSRGNERCLLGLGRGMFATARPVCASDRRFAWTQGIDQRHATNVVFIVSTREEPFDTKTVYDYELSL
jgi:hypothetical protein